MVYKPTEEQRSKKVTIECKGGAMNDGPVIQNMNNIHFYAGTIIALHMYNALACLQKTYSANMNLCIKNPLACQRGPRLMSYFNK